MIRIPRSLLIPVLLIEMMIEKKRYRSQAESIEWEIDGTLSEAREQVS